MLKSSKNVKMVSLYLTWQNHSGTLSNTLLSDTETEGISAPEKETKPIKCTQFAARQLGGEKTHPLCIKLCEQVYIQDLWQDLPHQGQKTTTRTPLRNNKYTCKHTSALIQCSMLMYRSLTQKAAPCEEKICSLTNTAYNQFIAAHVHRTTLTQPSGVTTITMQPSTPFPVNQLEASITQYWAKSYNFSNTHQMYKTKIESYA